MGSFSALLAAAKTFSSGTRFAEQLAAYGRQQGDPTYAGGAAVNEVQRIAQAATAAGGSYTLTFVLQDGTTFTTGAILYDRTFAQIQAIIDTASPAAIGNGHIVVTGGPLASAAIVITFSGASVAGLNHGQTTLTNSLTDGMDPIAAPAVTTTTTGGSTRDGWAILKALGVITSDPPAQGADATVVAGSNLLNVKPWFIREIAQEIAAQDGNPQVYRAIVAACIGTATPSTDPYQQAQV